MWDFVVTHIVAILGLGIGALIAFGLLKKGQLFLAAAILRRIADILTAAAETSEAVKAAVDKATQADPAVKAALDAILQAKGLGPPK